MFRQLLLIPLFILFALDTDELHAEDSDWAPIVYSSGSRPVVMAADPRLELGLTGSIEILINITDDVANSLPKEMAVLSIENHARTRLRVVFTESGSKLGLFDGKVLRSIPFDITDSGFYHIGLSTTGTVTRVYQNGKFLGELDMGYNTKDELPVYIGGQANKKATFLGEIHYIRIWDKALSAKEYLRTHEYFGFPASLKDLTSHVQMYSLFTTNNQNVVYTRQFDLSDISHAESPMMGTATGSLFVDVIPNNTILSKIIATTTDRITSIQFVVKNQFGDEFKLQRRGNIPEGKHTLQVFELNDGEQIVSVEGTIRQENTQTNNPDGSISATRINALQSFVLLTSDGRKSPAFGLIDPADKSWGGPSFGTRFPNGFSLDAIFGYFSANSLYGIGFAPDIIKEVAHPDGRWKPISQPDRPEKLDDSTVKSIGGRTPNGSYKDRQVVRIRTSNRGRTLELLSPGMVYAPLTLQADNSYSNEFSSIKFSSETELTFKHTTTANNQAQNYTVRYSKVKPYPRLPETQDFIPIGGNFSQDLQVPDYTFSFYGYDLTEMNPLNFQARHGQRKKVLKMPESTSRDYRPDLKMIVPFGLLLALDEMDTSTLNTVTISSSSEYSSSLSNSLGLNIGIPKVASFGINSSVTTSAKKQGQSGRQLAMGEEVKTKRGLVFDPSHMQLDAEFYQSIINISLRRSRGETVDYLAEIIQPYGTHYPNAITIGQIEHNFLSYSKQAYSDLHSKKKSLGVSAKGTFKKVKIGGKFEHQSEFSTEVNNDIEQQVKTMTKIGSDDTPIPVYMDMRPLDQLLNSLYFDDARVWAIQAELRQFIQSYIAGRAPAFTTPEDIWEPYIFSMQLDKVVFDISDATQIDYIVGDFGFDIALKNKPETIVLSKPKDDAFMLLHANFDGTDSKKSREITLPHDRKSYIFTAKELCEKSIATALQFGGRTGYVWEDVFGFVKYDGGPVLPHARYIYPINLSQNDSQFELKVDAKSNDGKVYPVTLYASARREPNIEGVYKPMPTCN